MIKQLAFIFLVITLPLLSFAQSFPYQHYDIDDNLASDIIYKISADTSGYFWIATDNGLNKFDGSTFKLFNHHSGLKSNSFIDFCINKQNEIWITPFRKGIQIIRHDSVFDKNLYIDQAYLFYHMSIYNNQLYFINDGSTRNLYKIVNDSIKAVNAPFPSYCTHITGDNKLLLGSKNGVYIVNDSIAKKMDIIGLGDRTVLSIASYGNTLVIGSYNSIIKVVNNEVRATYKTLHAVESIKLDKDTNIWFGMKNGGAGYITNNRIYRLLDDNIPVSDVFIDKQNTTWYATHGYGLYQFSNPYITDYSNLFGNYISHLSLIDASTIAVGNGKKLAVLKSDNKTSEISLPDMIITSATSINNKIYATGQSDLLGQSLTFLTYTPKTLYKHATAACYNGDSIIYVSFYGFLEKLVKKGDVYKREFKHMLDSTQTDKAYTISKIENSIWVGTTGPIYKVTASKIEELKQPEFYGTSQITYDANKNIWIASRSGLFKIKNGTTKPELIYNESQVTSFKIFNEELWIGTDRGLVSLRGEQQINITSSLGLPGNHITCLLFDSSRNGLWVGTDRGLCLINTTQAWAEKENHPLKVFFTSVETIKDTLSIGGLEGPLIFNSNINYLKFNFSSINYFNSKSTQYQYSLDHENWITISDLSIDLSQIRFGDHTLQVRIKNPNSRWTFSKQIGFTIATPFTKTPLFVVLVSMAAVLALAILILIRNRNEQRRNIRELLVSREITQLKHKSLHAMMNPHFIFNSLSSIQYFVTTKQDTNANIYIAELAKLIRLNLTQSNENEVSLKSELEFINLYLKLEKIRYEEKFDFTLKYDDITDDLNSIKMPPFLVQPLIENAIIHGILPMKDKGLIKIDFTIKKGILTITITDNGIGYSPNPKSKKHQSFALEILKTRVTLRNDSDNGPNTFKISKIQQGNLVTGTEAVITLKV